MVITCVWIEEGCIACGACPISAPAIFVIPDADDEAVILGNARMDGMTGSNRVERSPLRAAIAAEHAAAIVEAAEGCPVDVIRIERG